jgi:hypothetical protein
MKEFNHDSVQATENDLGQVLEPLVSYICAADRPKAVLNQAVSFLLREVNQINRAARLHLATLSENQGQHWNWRRLTNPAKIY